MKHTPVIPPPPPNSPPALLVPPPKGADIKVLERLWLRTSVAYELFDQTLMADADWDHFAAELQARRHEWSPYFAQCIPSGIDPVSGEATADYNVGTTASGIDWSKGVAKLFWQEAKEKYG